MTLLTAVTRRALMRLETPVLLALLGLSAALPARLDAQCTLTTPPLAFEPNPPGVSRPSSLSSGKQSDLQLYSAAGVPTMLMMEAFGYSILDLSTPANPRAVVYDDMRFSNEMPAVGDGQSYISTMGISADGLRGAFSLNGNASPQYGTIVGSGSGQSLNAMKGGFMPRGAAGGTVVQFVNNRYLVYTLLGYSGQTASGPQLYVTDVTNLPGTLAPTNLNSEGITTVTGGSNLSLAGNNVVFLKPADFGQTNSSITVINASSPGPVGNIQANFTYTTITSADVGGGTPTSFSTALDPSDSSKIWVLVETSAPVAYALVSVRNGVKSSFGSPFPIPSAPGETWVGGGVSALVSSGNNLFALMWARRTVPSQLFRLFSNSVAAWGVPGTLGQFDVNPATYPLFGLRTAMRGLAGSGNAIYAYVPTSNSAFVLPMNCVSSNVPAIASLGVVNQSGTSLSSGASVFLGDTLTITPSINPPPSLQPLTGFAWRFDFDFHVGVPYDDNGTSASPRLNAPDLSNGTPPSQITLVGPCDPQVGATTPATGVGCWNSVTTNSSFGGPDFGTSPIAGATRALNLAFEANNQLGSAGAGLFTLNWTVPAIRLKSTQILTGGAVDATGSDGHPSPLSGGYLWYFGIDPSAPAGETLFVDPGCTGPTCAHAFFGTGTRNFNVWVTVPYANGYVSPDCPGLPVACTPTTPLHVQVADVLPKFLVNGHSGPPITVLTGSSMTITNQTQLGAVSGVSYAYGLCTDVTGVSSACQPSNALSFSGSTASITAPTVPTGSWYLFFRVSYNGGTTIDWLPSIPGVSNPKAFPISVSNVIPQIHVFINGVDPCAPGFSCNPNEVDAFTGDTLTAWSYVGGAKDPQQPAISWSFPGATPPSGSVPAWTGSGFNDVGVNFSYGTGGSYTITMNGYGTPYSVAAVITQRSNPLSVSVTATPNPASVNASVAFACHASGGAGGYSYAWSQAFSASGANANHTFTTAGTYSAQCTVTDSASHTAGGVVNLSVSSGGGGSNCPNTDFHISVDGGPQFPPSFSVASGHLITFIPAGNYATYLWNFGDGSSTSTTQTSTHTYVSGGTYTASLTANGCTRSYSIVVTGAGGGGGPTPSCATVQFSIRDLASGLASCGFGGCTGSTGTALSFIPNPAMTQTFTSWDFGDGTTSTDNPGTHTYAGGGTFNVTLTAGACTNTVPISIAGAAALTGGFSEKYADNSALVAAQVASGKDVTFLATDTADSYTWDFGDGTEPATGQTPTHSFFTLTGATNATYTVTLSVTRGTGTTAQNASTSQLFTILPPPAPPTWFVAGLAYLKGNIAGSLWQSDVTLFNPDPSRSASYSVAFLDGRTPVDPSNLNWISGVNLGPQESISSPNILGGFFGQAIGSYGALIVRGDVAPVPPVITARTFNSGDPAKGTFGLSVPSTQPASGLSPQTALSQQLLIGLRDGPTSYTNVGLMNLTTDWSHAQLTFFDQNATLMGQMNLDVPPYGVAQLSSPLTAAPPNGLGLAGPLEAFTVRVSILSGGVVFPYATVIDKQSTDSIVVTASDHPSATYRMPGIIRLAGVNGTVWRSRFYVSNPSTNPRSVSLSYSFIPCDPTGCKGRVTGLQNDIVMQPGQTLWVDDFPAYWLGTVFGFTLSDTTAYQASYIDVAPSAGDPNQDPLLVLGETYNDQPTGPVGLQVPGFSAADAASATGANKRLLLGGLVSNDSFRTNVALFLQSGSTGSCVVHVLSPTGEELAHQSVGFNGATTFVQLNDAGLFAPIPGSKDRLTVIVDSFVGAPISGYATIVDNTSGDATFVKAQPGP